MGLITASQINNVFLKKYTSAQIIRIALICQSLIGLALATTTFFGWGGLFITIFLIFLFLSCQGFIFPNSSALSLAAFGHNAGSASALMGAIQMSIGAGASALVSYLQNNTALPMTGVMACSPILAFLIFSWGSKIIAYKASRLEVEVEDVDMISTL
jgi:DHA1 family bicyclomycin/chloramphenicol resistance-like MFS transporter